MKLGELKKSLSRFSPDMDDCEVILSYMDNGKESYDSLSFVAYSEMSDEITCIIFGSMESCIERMKQGNLSYPDGTKPSNEGFPFNE